MNRLLLLLPLVSVIAIARLNPFEPVNAPNMPIKVQMKPTTNADDGNRTVTLIYAKESQEAEHVSLDKSMEDTNMTKKAISKNTPDMALKESNVTMTQVPMVKEEIKEEKKVVKPKPKPTLIEKCYKPLPFLTIDLKKNKLEIESRDKYKVKKLYTIPSEKKIVIDFSGSVKHYTKNGMFVSKEFESFKIGNHPEQNFFRVVIKTKHNPEKYLPVIEKNMLTITYKK